MISSPNMVFLVVLEFELRPCTYWASTVPLKPCPNPKNTVLSEYLLNEWKYQNFAGRNLEKSETWSVLCFSQYSLH
jgi:hypothetical protein